MTCFLSISGRPKFLEEDSFDWEHYLSLKRPSEVNHRSVDNTMHRGFGMPDFTFEEPFSLTRYLLISYLSYSSLKLLIYYTVSSSYCTGFVQV